LFIDHQFKHCRQSSLAGNVFFFKSQNNFFRGRRIDLKSRSKSLNVGVKNDFTPRGNFHAGVKSFFTLRGKKYVGVKKKNHPRGNFHARVKSFLHPRGNFHDHQRSFLHPHSGFLQA